MLMRRARAYCSFCSHVVWVHVHPLSCTALFCLQNCKQITKNPYFRGSRSIEVIDVDVDVGGVA